MPEWRQLERFPGYEVSDAGEVRSLRCRSGLRPRPRPVAQRIDGHGYRGVQIVDKFGVVRSVRVHWLVLRAFRGERPEGMQGRHLDDNQANNSLDNLVWGTRAENVADAVKHGRYKSKERHWNARLTPDAVAEIRRCAGLESHASMALRLGVSRTTVTNVLLGNSWRAR